MMTPLLKELAFVAKTQKQKEVLTSLWTQANQGKELTPKQRDLANKLYLANRERLVDKVQGQLFKELPKLNPELYSSYFQNLKSAGKTHYTMYVVEAAIARFMTHPLVQELPTFNEMCAEYGRHFLLQ